MHRLTRIIATLVLAALAAGCAGATAASAPPVDSTTSVEAEPPSTTTTAAPVVTSTTSTTRAIVAPAQPSPAVPPAVPLSGDCFTNLARSVGWPEETLAHLEFIMRRESGCDPTAFANRPSTLDLSRGLLQINAYGSLDAGVRRLCGIDPATLFDPTTNLACGLELWHAMGWAPWGG